MKPKQNSTAVRRIATRSMKANHTRNLFALLAIVLTTFMISTVFSIGLSFAKNYQAMQLRLSGTSASIFLNNPSGEQLQKIKAASQVEAAGTQISVGTAAQKTKEGKNANIAILSYDQTEWEKHITPAIGDVHGSYPKAEDEIMLSSRALSQLGIESPMQGMAVPLTYRIDGEIRTDSFRLSGWYTEYKITQSGGEALVSEGFCRSHGLTAEKSGILAVSCSASRQEEVLENLKQLIPLEKGQEFSASFSAAGESASGNMIAAAVIIMLALFTSGCILTLGNGVMYLISKSVTKIADYAVFTYPVGLVAALIAVLFAVCLIVPALVFRATAKESVTERLHRAD